MERVIKETASLEPDLERAVQQKAEKRIKRGTNKLLLHAVRRKRRISDQ